MRKHVLLTSFLLDQMSHSCDLLLSVFVRRRTTSFANFWTFLAFSLEPLNQFQPDLVSGIYGWRDTQIVNFIVPVPLGPWGRGKNYPKLTNFQKSSLEPHMWRKNWMYGDVEQEGLYQNCEIYNPRDSRFAPRGGQTWYIHLNIFNFFLITTAPILFKFDMMYLRDKGGINCEFQSPPFGPMGWGKECQNWPSIRKSSSLKLHVCKKN
jgi:hypothetical protein